MARHTEIRLPARKRLDIYSILEYIAVVSDWEIKRTDQFLRDLKKLQKARPVETAKVLLNLDTYLAALRQCDNPLQLIKLMTCVHREESGCHAITQQPLPRNAIPVRLYLYACVINKIVYLICAGTKQSQHKDNQFCKSFIQSLSKK